LIIRSNSLFSLTPGSRPPPTARPPLLGPSPEAAASSGGSEYAVTYRRGTGLVSGGAGTQGTYTCLDPEGQGPGEAPRSGASPGLSAKGRRAAMHITGPTMVTVPLHITSNLALGVLQGGGAGRVVLRGGGGGGHRGEGKEGGDKGRRRESRGVERKAEGEVKGRRGKETDGEEKAAGGGGEEAREGKKKEEEVRGECRKPEMEGGGVSKEPRAQSPVSNGEENNDVDEYMGNFFSFSSFLFLFFFLFFSFLFFFFFSFSFFFLFFFLFFFFLFFFLFFSFYFFFLFLFLFFFFSFSFFFFFFFFFSSSFIP